LEIDEDKNILIFAKDLLNNLRDIFFFYKKMRLEVKETIESKLFNIEKFEKSKLEFKRINFV